LGSLILSLLLAVAATSPEGTTEAAPSPAERAEARLDEAASLMKEDRYEEALDIAGSVVEARPDVARAHVLLADALYRRGDFDEAERHYRRAVALDDDNAEAHFGVGRILRTLGRYGDAAASFSRAAALDPEVPRYLRVLANHLARREDTIGMLERYLELVRLHPDPAEDEKAGNVEAWLALLRRAGDAPLSSLVRKEPGSVRLQVHDGQAYLKLDVGDVKNQRFVFDTGATGVTVSPRLARRAHLEPIRPFTITGTGARRTESGDLVLIPGIAIGEGIALSNVPATVRDPTGPEEGLIGPSLLSAFDITVDLHKGLLVLETPSGTPRAGTALPFRNVGGEILVEALVNGVALNAMVDTGSATTIIGRTTLARVPDLKAAPGEWFGQGTVGVGGALADRKVVIAGTLGFGGRDYPADGLVSGNLDGFSRSLESEVYVILGAPHLDDRPFTIDYRAMTVTFAAPPQR